jgi:hypothetical protein
MSAEIIRDPGKFEGEPVYVRDMWTDIVCNGMEDESLYDAGQQIYVLVFDKMDRATYALDDDDYAILLWEDSVGFVHSRHINEADLNAFRKECEWSTDED